LSDDEAGELLRHAGVPPRQVPRLKRFARGHPLALKLAAQTLLGNPNHAFGDVAEHAVVDELTRRDLGDIEDPLTLAALNAAAVVRRTTRSLLRAMLGPAVADDAFQKLSSLSFVEGDRDGLFAYTTPCAPRRPPPCARVIPTRTEITSERRGASCVPRCGRPDSPSCGAIPLDLMYLIENPIVREAFFPGEMHSLIVEPARREDGPALHAIMERHESSTAAAVLKRWWTALPAAFHVVRDTGGVASGFYCMFELGALGRWAPVDDVGGGGWRLILRCYVTYPVYAD
jgi:hypothetical protein